MDDLDPDSRLALAIVDERSPASSGESLGFAQQLESLRSIIDAFETPDGEPLTPVSPAEETWGTFILKEELGRGSFGIVRRAFDPATARDVAVKLYRKSELPAEPRLLGQVRHPNVVAVFGAAVHEGKPGIWMELVPGRSLAERVQAEGPVAPAQAVRVGVDLCLALAAVHAAGLVHQDVKPRNVMQEPDGRVVLMDFGAGLFQDEGDHAAIRRFSGTPLYMAPEVLLGARPSMSSDVYSLGVLIFYLLTGTYPVYATNLQELKHLHQRPLDRSARRYAASLLELRPDVPAWLARAVAKALVPAAERYANFDQLRVALEGQEARKRPLARWLVVGASAAVLAGLAGLRTTQSPRVSPVSPSPAAAEPAITPAVLLQAAPPIVAGTGTGTAASAAVPAEETYEVDAGVILRQPGGDRRLRPGDTVAVGDQLALSFTGSRALHVYIISQDDKGRANQLFPMTDCRLHNPIAAGRHALPGVCAGEETSWVVTKAGGHEHFLVLASPIRLTAVEQHLAGLAKPSWTAAGARREVGGRTESAPDSPGSFGFREIEQMAQSEGARKARAHGVWFQEIVLESASQ